MHPANAERDLAQRLLARWQQGERPELGAFLAEVGPLRPEVLFALVEIDQRQRWLAGERPGADHYLSLYPTLAGSPGLSMGLMLAEQRLREEVGASSASLATRPTEPPATEPPPAEVPPTAAPGTRAPAVETFTGYHLVRELGRGGMGVVYEAVDAGSGRHVALKVVQGASPELLRRFKEEFRSLVGLSHPNLVTLYELVAEGPAWYFTMELIEGERFLDHVRGAAARGTPLTAAGLRRLRPALAQLAEGVANLHAAGKLHRDLKPGNVLVSREGRVVVLDFGLAAEMDSAGLYHSAQPRLLGTIPYMAPEQAACLPVSPASDWYAVGVILFEALTGRFPFEGASHEVLSQKQEADAPSPRQFAPDAPDDLVALSEALLQRDPADRPAGDEIRRLVGREQPASAPLIALSEAPLIGRGRELQALAEALARTREGRTVVVRVWGRSGAGKSALVRAFSHERLEEGNAVVLAGRCFEQESVPYKGLDSLIDSLARYLEALPRHEVEALLPRDAGALARVFPVLRTVSRLGTGRRAIESGDPIEARRRALAALRELLGRLGDRRPLVLTIDDLQWGDEDSAAVLADLLREPSPPVLLLVVAYREEDARTSPCLLAFDRALTEAPSLDRLDLPLGPLAEGDQHALAAALLGEQGPARVAAVARQSGGMPFFLHELARFAREGHALEDVTVTGMLHERVGRLPEVARRLLEVVAVAGQPVGMVEACEAAGVGADGPQALALLRSERLARGTGDRLETYHDRVREAVVRHLAPAQLAAHHRRLAEALAATGGADPESLAVHLLGAGEPGRAGDHFALAADRAAAALAFDRAARLYRQALGLLAPERPGEDRRRLHVRLGEALANAGQGAAAASAYLTASEGASSEESLDLRRRAALHLLSSGRIDAGLEALRQVLASVGLSLFARRWWLFACLGWQRLRLWWRGLGHQLRPAAEVPADELARLDVCATASVGLSMVDTIQGAYFQTRALLLALHAGEPVRLATALAVQGAHVSIGGTASRASAERFLSRAEALAEQLGQPYPRAMVRLSRGLAAALAGEWERALALCDEAEGDLRAHCHGTRWELGTAHRFALWPLVYLGRLAEVARRLPGLIQEARERDDLFGETNLCLMVRTMLRLAQDQPELARQELADLMGRWSQEGFHVQHMNRLYDEVQIDLYQDDAASAWRRLSEGWPALRASKLLLVQQVRIFLTHLRGRAALAVGTPERVADALRDARALEKERAPWAAALAALLRAGAASCQGRGEEARRWLQEGERRCAETGMGLYAAAARWWGAERRGEAAAWMREQGVVRPERLGALLVPGVRG